MIAFKEKVEYILNGMPPEAWPADSTLFSWFYGKIKVSRGMQRVIDKIKDSAPNSNTRSFLWLWEQFSDYLAELREDQNERDFREAMTESLLARSPGRKRLFAPVPHTLKPGDSFDAAAGKLSCYNYSSCCGIATASTLSSVGGRR